MRGASMLLGVERARIWKGTADCFKGLPDSDREYHAPSLVLVLRELRASGYTNNG